VIPVFSDDGKRFAYTVNENSIGQTTSNLEAVLEPQFTPDRTRIAYWTRQTSKWSAVIDGQRSDTFDQFRTLTPGKKFVFSADNRHIAYIAKRAAREFVVVDGISQPGFDGIIANGPVLRDKGTVEYLSFLQKLHLYITKGGHNFCPPCAILPAQEPRFRASSALSTSHERCSTLREPWRNDRLPSANAASPARVRPFHGLPRLSGVTSRPRRDAPLLYGGRV
jgi:hypothetical protein